MEQNGRVMLNCGTQTIEIRIDEVEILSEDIPGWLVAVDGRLTVALDISLTPELIREGYAREFVNRIQNLRKENGFEVTDRVNILISSRSEWADALTEFKGYICTETLAESLELVAEVPNGIEVEINELPCFIKITKIK
jgi:isoleucyl-tRNA synthetase